MKNTFKASLAFGIISISACSTFGKKSPDQLVFDAGINKDNKAVIEAIQSGAYAKPEIEAIAQKAMDQRLCSLAYDVTSNYQLDPNLKSKYQTLFQCLLLDKQYDAALSMLKQGANPEFIKEARYERNDALEEATAWGAIDVVDELLRLGMKPTSKAFYLGVSGHYHSSYETAVKFVDMFKPFMSSFDLDYVFVNKPLLYEVTTERKFNVEQRRNLAKMLLDNGADPNKGINKTEYGSARNVDYIETPYMAVKGIPEFTSLFLAYGANPEYEQMREQAKFLANLKPGDKAQQGLIIEIKSNMALVQEESGQRWIQLQGIEP
ncbi:hypothetical protein [Litoribrevibacter albus]|uniref:Ankyrin repeat domain-containing protein n=1 Tax=Litoribrevibacter albus TaxID=1473156 RepID=A0AA37SAC4_9GAMM|nr:hypothetical protein [Litoribrevibacter albus]GLQ31426.1 hypothetical protein GCM10007876_19050 [Litoribrevibacter albus]